MNELGLQKLHSNIW